LSGSVTLPAHHTSLCGPNLESLGHPHHAVPPCLRVARKRRERTGGPEEMAPHRRCSHAHPEPSVEPPRCRRKSSCAELTTNSPSSSADAEALLYRRRRFRDPLTTEEKEPRRRRHRLVLFPCSGCPTAVLALKDARSAPARMVRSRLTPTRPSTAEPPRVGEEGRTCGFGSSPIHPTVRS
jgi:hypothetical protein